MRTLILATGENQNLCALSPKIPPPLLPILDKSILEHILDKLSSEGCRQVSIVLSESPQKIESEIGDGKKWGISIDYHLSKTAQTPLSTLIPILQGWKNPYLMLITADCLPLFSFHQWIKTQKKQNRPIHLLFPSKKWTGWGIFKRKDLLQIPANTPSEDFLNACSPQSYDTLKTRTFLSVKTLKDLQASNLKLLQTESSSLFMPSTVKMVEPGIWIGRGAVLHPTAEIRPPVYIGEQSHINPYASIGPYTVIGSECLIDAGSSIDRSLITKRSYVGQGLQIHNAIINENRLIDLTHNTHMSLQDPTLLAKLETPSFQQFLLKLIGRTAALSLILLFSPIYAFLYLTHPTVKKEVISLPAPRAKELWSTFSLFLFDTGKKNTGKGFLSCLPMLFNILKGDLHFTGLPPRTKEEVASLPTDWKQLYLSSKTGLITLTMVEHKVFTQDDYYISEAYYTANQGLKYDLTLAFRWLLKRGKIFFFFLN